MRKQEVFVSQGLVTSSFGKPVFSQLQNILGDRLNVLPISNVWCRDYMPIIGCDGLRVLFKYAPSYLVGEEDESTIPTDLAETLDLIGIGFEEKQDIVLDGGAIDRHVRSRTALLSDRVISENSSKWIQSRSVVLKEIKDILYLKKLVVIPSDPWDMSGHVDGTARIVGTNHVVICDPEPMLYALKKYHSKYEYEKYQRWADNLETGLKENGFQISYIPSLNHLETESDSAWGVYLNFLLLDDMIIMPFFKNQEKVNKQVQKKLESLYNLPVEGVYADDLSREGGIINCCTWQHYG